MPFNGSGTFVRTQNWTNDASNNLPISATKFDNEDNDFASGLSLCLTRDGQGAPNNALTWVQPLTINLAADGQPAAWGRTGGANNPQLQVKVADATGATLNLSTAQTLALAIQGTNVISMTATTVSIAQALSALLAAGTVGAPSLAFAGDTNTGLYHVGADDIGVAVGGVQALDIQANQLAVLGAAATSATLAIGGNGVSIANAFQIVYGAAGGVTFNYAGGAVGTISSAGAWSIPAASTAVTATINGAANNNALRVVGSSTSGQSKGVRVEAGSTTADISLEVLDKTATTDYFYVLGNGETYMQIPPASTNAGVGGCFQVGYLDCPQNLQGSSYTLAITDRGKSVVFSGGTTCTIPANASVAFPIGTTIVVINRQGVSMSLAITSDTLILSGTGTSGTRTLGSNAVCTCIKTAAAVWLAGGPGVT